MLDAAIFPRTVAIGWLKVLMTMAFMTLAGSSLGGTAGKPQTAQEAYQRGYNHLQNLQLPESIREFTETIRLAPNHGLAYWGRGWARGLMGDYKGLITDFTEAMQFGIESPDMYYNRGVAREHLGEHQEALADMERCRRLLQAIELVKQRASSPGPVANGCNISGNSHCRIGCRFHAGRRHLCGLATQRRGR